MITIDKETRAEIEVGDKIVYVHKSQSETPPSYFIVGDTGVVLSIRLKENGDKALHKCRNDRNGEVEALYKKELEMV